MAKLIALDIGAKRTGVAETDFLQIIAEAVETIDTANILPYLKNRFRAEAYEAIIIGQPLDLKGNDSHNSALVREVSTKLKEAFKETPVHLIDERFTSKIAMRRLIDSGVTKTKRRQKGSLDAESAAVILESYLASK